MSDELTPETVEAADLLNLYTRLLIKAMIAPQPTLALARDFIVQQDGEEAGEQFDRVWKELDSRPYLG